MGNYQYNILSYAPSIPLSYELNEKKANIKDLLVRAKTGMQAGDVQKEAH